MVSGLMFFNPFQVNFCVLCKVVVQLHSLAHGYPVFPTSFIEETVLSLLYILGSFDIC